MPSSSSSVSDSRGDKPPAIWWNSSGLLPTTPRTLRIDSTLRTPSTSRTSASVAASISARRRISDSSVASVQGHHNKLRPVLQHQIQLLQVLLNRQDLLAGDMATAAWPVLVLEDHA